MADGINVGSVEVTVVPDASDFNRRLKADLANPPDVKIGVDTTEASVEVDAFLAETDAKAKVAGDQVGRSLASNAAASAKQGSPLIVAAVTGGLMLGAPAIAAASLVAFGGIAAAVAAQDPSVKAAFSSLWASVKSDLKADAADIAPTFDLIAAHAGAAFNQLAPEIHAALVGIAPDVLSMTDAIEGAATTAMPSFVHAIQQGQPIVQGLDTLIRDLGTGVGGLMDQITAHAPAAGQDLALVGQILGQALPILGQLVGVGAELGTQVLPVLSGALGLFGGALNLVAPILPEVAAGFVAWKVISSLSGPLDLLSAKLQTVAADSGGLLSTLSGKAAGGVSALGSALPIVGIGVGLVAAALPALVKWLGESDQYTGKVTVSMTGLNSALQQTNGTIDQSVTKAAALALQQAGLFKASQQWGVSTSTLTQAVLGNKGAMEQVTTAAGAYKDKQDAAAQSTAVQADKTGIAASAYKEAGIQSDQWLAAIQRLAGGTDSQVQKQKDLATAVQGASAEEQTNATRLQGIANTASAANTQISLLKGALDALTGKAITMDEAEIAVTQSVSAATAAVQNHSATLSFTNGILDLSNDKSAQAAQLLIGLAGTQHQEIATLEQQGASTDVVNQKSDALRQQFIRQAEQLGATAGQAQALADKYYGIPGQVKTEVTADTIPAQTAINSLLQGYQHVQYTGSAIIVNGRTIANAEGNLLPMSATTASIVQPGALRVIGDNPVADEAFIPINSSARSLSILGETAARMGLGLHAMANGGLLTDYGSMRALAGQGLLDEIGAKAKDAVTSYMPPVPPGGAGVERWRPLVDQVLAMLGISRSADNGVLNIIQHESGGNPRAINLTDSNARAGHPSQGLMQTIPSTFARWAGPYVGRGITDPLANIYAGVNYALHTYGAGMLAGGGNSSGGRYIGYDSGGLLPPGPSLVYNGTGAPELVAPTQTFKQVMAGAGGGAAGQTLQGMVFNGPVEIKDTDAMNAKAYRHLSMAAARFR